MGSFTIYVKDTIHLLSLNWITDSFIFYKILIWIRQLIVFLTYTEPKF